MSRRVSRLHALLAGAVLLFANGRGMLGPLDCPQHGIQTHSRTDAQTHSAADARHTTHDARLTTHDAHHSAPTPEKQHQHSGCTCLEHCSACQTAGMPSVAVRLPESRFVLGAADDRPVAARRIPSRAPHQLPFAHAPPAIA